MTETTPPDADRPAGGPAPARPARRRRGVLIGATAAVLAVVAGAAVYATTALSGGGRQPDELVPKGTFAYLKVDLDPAANQKLAARSFFGRFPKLGGSGDGDGENVFESVLAQVVSGEVDFRTDVKPWFDRRAAVAAFPSGEGTALVSVLRSKDDGKARAALDRVAARATAHGETLAYRIDRGYAVVGESRAAVDEAVRASAKESLRDNETYRKDVDRLDGDQIAVGWVDLGQAFTRGKELIPFSSLVPDNLTGLVKGRLVAGVHLADDYAEMSGLAFGLPALGGSAKPSAAVLEGLPAGTFAAVSANGATLRTALGAGGEEVGGPLGLLFAAGGISVADDVLPLLGDTTVVALGRVFAGLDTMRAALVSTVSDAAAAERGGKDVAAALSGLGLPVTSSVKGTTFYLGTEDYPAELANGGGLGATPKFRKALPDVGTATLAAYVDLQAYVASRPRSAAKYGPLRALGLVAGSNGDGSYFRVRVTVG